MLSLLPRSQKPTLTCYIYSPLPFVPEVFCDQADPNQREHDKYSDENRTRDLQWRIITSFSMMQMYVMSD